MSEKGGLACIHRQRFYRRNGLILIMCRTHSVLLRGKQLSPIQHILKEALITVRIKVEAGVGGGRDVCA